MLTNNLNEMYLLSPLFWDQIRVHQIWFPTVSSPKYSGQKIDNFVLLGQISMISNFLSTVFWTRNFRKPNLLIIG